MMNSLLKKMDNNSIETLKQISDHLSNKENYKLKFQSEASDFTISFSQPISLDPKRKYVFALKRFSVYNTLFNITKENNRFTYSIDTGKTWIDLYIPYGAYESKGLNKRLQSLIKSTDISIEADEETSQAILSIKNPNIRIDFTKPNSLNKLLGFKPKVYQDTRNISEDIIKITLTNDIDIHCSLITSNSYVNGINKPILYSISAYSVQVGAKIIISEINPIFLPINTSTIDSIRFQILDDNGKLLDFNSEVIILDCLLSQV
jgi:hypothetical protein